MMFSTGTGWKDINTTEETTARGGTNFNNQQLRAGGQAGQKERTFRKDQISPSDLCLTVSQAL